MAWRSPQIGQDVWQVVMAADMSVAQYVVIPQHCVPVARPPPARCGKSLDCAGIREPPFSARGECLYFSPARSRSTATLSVCSQVNSGSSRPKWP